MLLYLFWALPNDVWSGFSSLYTVVVLGAFAISVLYSINIRSIKASTFFYIILLFLWTSISAYSYNFCSNDRYPQIFLGITIDGKSQFFINLFILLIALNDANMHISISKTIFPYFFDHSNCKQCTTSICWCNGFSRHCTRTSNSRISRLW